MTKIILGLTGNICGGKSSIAKLLRENGYTVLDADSIAKKILYGPEYLPRMKLELGSDIVNKDGGLMKHIIRERLFGSTSMQLNINKLTHEVVSPEIMIMAKNIPDNVCFVESALIFEFYGRKWKKYFSGSIAICCNEATALTRMKIRNTDISDEQAKNIFASQMTPEEKMKLADVVLDTSNMNQEDYPLWVSENWPKLQ